MSVEEAFVETERVIAAVRARPVLWDGAHRLYKSRETRQHAWGELCRELVDGFDHYEHAERKAIEAKIQQRWRTARDCYVKTKSSQHHRPDGTKRTKAYEYVHRNMLTFLDRTMRLPAEQAPAPPSPPSPAPSPAPSPDHPEYTPPQNRTKLNKFRRMHAKTLQKSDIKGHLQRRGDTKLGRRADPAGKSGIMTEFEKQLLECLRKDTSPLEVDDSDFFKSLAPILKEFSNNQKLLFRSKVIEVAMAIHSSREMDVPLLPGEPSSSGQGVGGESYLDLSGVYLHEPSDHSPEEEKYCPF